MRSAVKHLAAIWLILAALFCGAWTHGSGQAPIFGVNVSGTEYWEGTFPTSSDWAYLQSKKITFARMPVAWESLQSTLGGSLNSGFVSGLVTSIELANSHGIGVIVDLHNGGCYTLAAEWGDPVTVGGDGCNLAQTGVHILGDGTLTSANLVNLWSQLATALAGTPGLVGYDVMNEPSLNIAGTNLLSQPNGFGDANYCPQCWTNFGGAPAQNALGTNPVNSAYSPSWEVTTGTGFGLIGQNYPASIVDGSPYTLSIYAKDCGGGASSAELRIGDVSETVSLTTSWQRFSYTQSPVGTGNQFVYFGAVAGGTANVYACFANAQFEAGSSASTYQPSTWLPYAQAAIAAIRGVDTKTLIYVEGQAFSCTTAWPYINWELATMTGGPFVFEAHQYFDTNVVGCGGGSYPSNFNSFGITVSNGVNSLTPFLTWGSETGNSIFVGEFGIPNTCCVGSPTGGNQNWTTLIGLFEAALVAAHVPATMWFYNTVTLDFQGTILDISQPPDDPRLLQMLLYAP